MKKLLEMKQINKAKLYKHLHRLPERFVYFYVVPWLTLKLLEVINMLFLCTLHSKQVLRILKDIGQKLLLSCNPQFSLLFYKESVAAKGTGLGGGGNHQSDLGKFS